MIYSMFRDRNTHLLWVLKPDSWGGREKEEEGGGAVEEEGTGARIIRR